MMQRGKFMFSNEGAQRAEAILNARETVALLEKRLPKHLQEPKPGTETTPAGACFRRVSSILAGGGK
jgi:hypothetical protein